MRAIVLASTALVLPFSPALAAPAVKLGGSITVTEGQSASMPIVKTGSGRAKFGIRTVPDSASEGLDFKAVNVVLSPYGSTAQTITTLDDAAVEGHERVKVQLYPVAGSKTVVDATPQYITIVDNDVAPPEPPPLPLTGLPPIASNFDTATAVQVAWGHGNIPGSAAPDVMGAFRFTCGAGQLLYDDPILYPGQPGKSHLHQFFGNTTADANSSHESLRAKGGSTCNQLPGDPYAPGALAANRSAYWMPAMLDGKGNVVRPDWILIYYKQVASQDHPACAGKCINIPNGLRFIYGWDPTGINSAKTGVAYFNCQGPTAKPGHYLDLTLTKEWCPSGNQLGAIIEAPSCWNGKDLDSPDHRSHVNYECTPAHPYRFPQVTQGVWYTVGPNDDPSLWTLSSDHMAPDKPRGFTFHADYFEAWDPAVKDVWWKNCIVKMLNASGGDLCNGKQLKGASQGIYLVDTEWGPRWLPRWKHPQPLVPIPAQ